MIHGIPLRSAGALRLVSVGDSGRRGPVRLSPATGVHRPGRSRAPGRRQPPGVAAAVQRPRSQRLDDQVRASRSRRELQRHVPRRGRTAEGALRQVDGLHREFGHIFYKEPFSYYLLAAEYRFVGEQVPARAVAWAIRNNGLMLHSPEPKTMLKDQDFPISLEIQLLGGLSDGKPGRRPICARPARTS